MKELLVEIHLDHTVTYEVPKWVADLLGNMARQWEYIYGRRPRFTFARGIDLIEQVFPGTRQQITITKQPREKTKPTLRGQSYDWVYEAWMNPPKWNPVSVPYENPHQQTDRL